jgi:hypothetical protein
VKIQDTTPTEQPNSFSPPSFPGERIIKLLLDLKTLLGQAAGQPFSYEHWGQLTGRPPNTIASWSAGSAAHQLQVLLASLERLTPTQRQELIDAACRDYPTLGHPKLAHDFVACSYLATLLGQATGFTVVQGGPEHLRTFLVTALGHWFGLPNPNQVAVAGVDIHRPDTFVPVLGLVYLDNLLQGAQIQREVHRLWPSIRATGARLMLLNGIWRKVPELQPEIIAAARESHVVVAEALALKPVDLSNRVPGPTHLITVSPAREQPQWLHVDIQAV